MKNIKWGLYAVSWGAIVCLTWGMPTVAYLMIQLAVLGVFVSGAINGND
jgi:hypothetical protein